ncbi:hypothetical protein vseg_015190 [Gypsophila vaccaria]
MGIEPGEYSSDDSDQDSDDDEGITDQFVKFDIFPIEVCKVEPQNDIIPTYPFQPSPNAKIYIFPNKYDRPIPVIAYFDTGAASSIIKPNILPPSHWEACSVAFKAANGQVFYISLKSKPIYIQLFPGYKLKTKVYGSDLPGKDFILGFDILHGPKRVSWHPKGLKHKNHLLPWTTTPHLYTYEVLHPIKEHIAKTSCAESHSEFLTKCSSPLRQNPDFFITLPFKKNEDIIPTKASHIGMNPNHYTLALQEVDQLQKENLIEPTTSPWACEAFYVNKRAEQVRGKLRLVINYQTLNHFLTDDKFPLPKREVLFQKLPHAQIFSKFDLKAGFWQLGIMPQERPKTGFCIPDRHYQWKVMPFGLKTAPSLFQKAMIKIFKPILTNALVYIDDILLFSMDVDSHSALLSKFHDIVQQ